MKTTLKFVKLYNELLDEESTDILFEKGDRAFQGALFFDHNPVDKIVEVLDIKEVQTESEEELVLKAIAFYKQHMESSGTLEKTMKHWQFLQGFTNHIFN